MEKQIEIISALDTIIKAEFQGELSLNDVNEVHIDYKNGNLNIVVVPKAKAEYVSIDVKVD